MGNEAHFGSTADVDSFDADAAMAAVGMWDAAPAVPKPSCLPPPRTSMPPTQIVFIEANFSDAQDLQSGVQPGVEAVLLDLAQHGLQQIAAFLASHNIKGLAGVEIVAHGADGAIQLGAAMLCGATLADYQSSRAQIGVARAPGAALQFYCCEVGQDAAGAASLDPLSQATGGASTVVVSHLVGDAAGVGSFELKVIVGSIDGLNVFRGELSLSAAYPPPYAVAFDADSASNARLEQVAVNNTSFVAGGDIRDPAVDTVSRGPAGRPTVVDFLGRRPMTNDLRRQRGLDDGSPARISRQVIFDPAYDRANNKTGNFGP